MLDATPGLRVVDGLEEGRLHDEVVDMLPVCNSDLMEDADLGRAGTGAGDQGRPAGRGSSPPEGTHGSAWASLELQDSLTSRLNSLLA